MLRFLLASLLIAWACHGQPPRVLYVTRSAGYRHDSIPASAESLRSLGTGSGQFEVVVTEDLSLISRESLGTFSAVLFFTSGELPLRDQQKADLLEFVRNGGGFGGVHSATDTLYTWPEYLDLAGARFDGHPWVQEVRIDIEDPDHPATHDLAPGFSITDEIYQVRDFSRSRNRVLMTLDTSSVDLDAPGVHRTDGDFPLAWVGSYGQGRTFYTALGHFEGTWRDARFRSMLLHAVLWLTRQEQGDASPRPPAAPAVRPEGIGNAATFSPRMKIAPGSLVTIFGTNLTPGSTSAADFPAFRYKLAGATIRVNGSAVPLLYASPGQINAYLPGDLAPQGFTFDVAIASAGYMVHTSADAAVATPGIFAFTRNGPYLTIWATGLGPVRDSGTFLETLERPDITVEGRAARILYCGLAPGWPGLYQINAELPEYTYPALGEFRFGGYTERFWL